MSICTYCDWQTAVTGVANWPAFVNRLLLLVWILSGSCVCKGFCWFYNPPQSDELISIPHFPLLSLSCFWCRFSIRRRGHKASFHLCLEGSTRGAKRKVAEIFRTWKSFLYLQDEGKCPPKITWDTRTDSSSLKGFSWHLRGCLFSFYLLLMEYDSPCMQKVKVAQSCLFATPWTIQSMEFSRPGYWSG